LRRLILVRHGESRWNAERRIQGQACAGLSPQGHAQAAATAVALAAAFPAAQLVTSDLQRTRETAAPLEAALGRRAVLDARLRERSFGGWERRLRDEVRTAEADRWRRWLLGEDVIVEVGGESTEQLTDRVEPALRELLGGTEEGGVTIAVTHGGPVWHGVHHLAGLAPGTFAGVDNASCHHLLAADGDGAVVVDRWNEVGHLPLHLRTGWIPASTATPEAGSDGPPVGR
jgi:broad specificity phosphatase PhoE